MATIPASENVFPEVLLAEVAAPAAAPSGQVRLYVKADGLLYWKDDAGTEYAVGQGDTAGHLADTADAHDASAISFDPTGLSVVTGTEVQTAIEELDAASGGVGVLQSYSHLRTAGNYTNATTGSFQDVDATNMAATLTTGPHRCLVVFTGTVRHSIAGGSVFLTVSVDGTDIGPADAGILVARHPTAANPTPVNLTYITDALTAASHTIKLRWQVGSGTSTIDGDGGASQAGAFFSVVELPVG